MLLSRNSPILCRKHQGNRQKERKSLKKKDESLNILGTSLRKDTCSEPAVHLKQLVRNVHIKLGVGMIHNLISKAKGH